MNTVEIKTPHSTHQVPEEKLTSLNLYVTAREAYEMWKADPEHIKVLDVRTFEEYVLIGHAGMAALEIGLHAGHLLGHQSAEAHAFDSRARVESFDLFGEELQQMLGIAAGACGADNEAG